MIYLKAKVLILEGEDFSHLCMVVSQCDEDKL